MPQLPDKIVNKTAEKIQGFFYFVAFMAGLFTYSGFESGDPASGMKAGLVCFVCALIGSKIKTTYNHDGSVGIYK